MADVSDLNFVEPWRPLFDATELQTLNSVLAREITKCHPLWGVACKVIARCGSNDEIAISCADGRYAIVSLGWNGPGNNKGPYTMLFANIAQLNDGMWASAFWEGFVDDFDPDDPRIELYKW